MKQTLLLFLMICSIITFAQSVIPFDTNFGESQGYTLSGIEGENEMFTTIGIQSDGKIITAGHSIVNGSGEYVLCRYTVDGILDNTFGNDGVVILEEEGNNYINDIKILSNDKILVVGLAVSGVQLPSFKSSVLRFNANGTLDNSFGNNGITEINTYQMLAYKILVQENNDIVVVGYRVDTFDLNIILAGIHSDGSINTDFGENGLSVYDFNGDEYVFSAITKENKIIAGVTIGTASYLMQFDELGHLDTTFGNNGKTEVVLDYAYPTDIKIQDDGKILCSLFGQNFKLVRYNVDGSLDASFGVNGLAEAHFSNKSAARNIGIDKEGNIYQVGHIEYVDNEIYSLGIAKYSSKGNLDTLFGNDGKYEFSLDADVNEYTGDAALIGTELYIVGANLRANAFITKLNFEDNNIFKIQPEKNVLLYPNPTVDILKFEYRLTTSTEVSIQLFSYNGQLIEEVLHTNQEEGLYKLNVNMNNYSSGAYILNFKTAVENINIPFIKR